MPIYEFECQNCGVITDQIFPTFESAAPSVKCENCGCIAMRRTAPTRLNFNVITSPTWRPAVENKWNFNPLALTSNEPGCGAEYQHRRNETLTDRPRYGNRGNTNMPLPGTVRHNEYRRSEYLKTGKKPSMREYLAKFKKNGV